MRTMRIRSSRDRGSDDAERLDLVDAGVGGVERARDGVEADLAGDLVAERAAQPGDVQAADVGAWQRRRGIDRQLVIGRVSPSRSRSRPRASVVAAAGERDAQRALAARSVGRAVDDDHAGVVEQAPADLVRRACPVSRTSTIAKKPPSGAQHAHARHAGERGRSPARAARVLVAHAADALLRRRSAPRRPRPGRTSPARGSTAAARGTSLWMIGAGAAQ